MKKMKIADDTANLTKIDFQADADVGVLTYPELRAISRVIDEVEENWTEIGIGACNPEDDEAILQIRIKRSRVDPYFDNLWLVLTRRWTVGHEDEGAIWTVSQGED